jgi:hypothetical protein
MGEIQELRSKLEEAEALATRWEMRCMDAENLLSEEIERAKRWGEVLQGLLDALDKTPMNTNDWGKYLYEAETKARQALADQPQEVK